MPTSTKSLYETILDTVEELLGLGKNVAPFLEKLLDSIRNKTELSAADRAALMAAATASDDVINKPIPDDDGTYA